MKTGKSRRERRQERGRVRQRERDFGERGRVTQQREKTALVDFDHWSKSTIPANLNDT